MVAAALFVLGVVLTFLTCATLRHHLPKRPNFTGRSLPTSAGLFFIPIILITFVFVEGDGGGYVAYSLAACVVGFVDDVWGGKETKGFRGASGSVVARQGDHGLAEG